MNENHEALIAILKDHFTQNHSFDAVLVVGSVARGDASTNSDIDLVFVTNDLNPVSYTHLTLPTIYSV